MIHGNETAGKPRPTGAGEFSRFKTSIVLPVWNERHSLAELDREVRHALSATGRRSEIIYVDDSSTDGSTEILRELVSGAREQAIRTRVIRLRRHSGQTAALAAGIDLAEGDVVVPLDADGQNNPADIPRLLEKMEAGFDVVSGWRRSRKDHFVSKRLPSVVANWLISKVSGVALHDFGCTLKAYRASLLKEVRLYGDMHRFLPVFLAHLGARVTEIEVDHRPRLEGASKYGSERVLKVLVDLVLLRFMTKYYTRPMHFFGKLGLLFLMSAGLTCGLMLAFKFGWLRLVGIDFQATFIETPLPALAATFFLGTVNSFFFGILGEVLIRIHHESSGLRGYVIQEVVDSREGSE